MPRLARKTSNSGYMHVIVRGIGKQILFEETADFSLFIELLEKYSQETCVTVCAYCLMGNHVHLLLLDAYGNIASLMKKLGVTYARYFNDKNGRTGHLFQDRYISEPVETEAYLVSVFRYILQNPQKAGIAATDRYRWSSYYCYGARDSFVDTSILETLIGDWSDYEKFMRIDDNQRYLDYERFRYDDEWAKSVICEHIHAESGTVMQKMSKTERDKCLRDLKNKGLSVRQLERLTGISKGVIQRA